MHRVLVHVLMAVLFCLSALSQPAGRAGAQSPIDDNAFLHLMPELRRAPAPAWVKPGLRITYYSAAALVMGGRYAYREDENGDWIQDGTGKRFRREELAGASGHGYTQVDVILVNQGIAVLDIWSYGITDMNGPVGIRAVSGAVGLPGAGSDFWLNPQVLGRYAGTQVPGLKIVRMPYTIGGRQFRAVRIQTVGGTAFSSWVFDEDSGLLLRSSSSTQGAPIRGPVAAGDSREGGTTLAQDTIIEGRTLNIPWASSAAPAWAGQVRYLRYDGRITVSTPGTPGATMPLAATYQRQYAGNNWARFIETTTHPGGTASTVRLFGPAQIGGLWVPPAVLAALQPGQVLDRDNPTGVVTSVGQVGRTQQGGETIQITRAGSGFRLDYVYDRRDGAMLYVGLTDPVLYMKYELWLAQRQ